MLWIELKDIVCRGKGKMMKMHTLCPHGKWFADPSHKEVLEL
jgi:hypothetical protein